MTIFDVPGIEHADVTAVGTIGWRIAMHEGWYIHLRDNEPGEDEFGNPTKVYKGAAILWTDYDFSLVEICAEADLPDNAQILATPTNPDHEAM